MKPSILQAWRRLCAKGATVIFGFDAACRYVIESAAMRDSLEIPRTFEVQIEPLGQGEHNANFLMTLPGGAHAVLRINFVSQMGLEQQTTYEFAALRELESSGVVPRALFLDDSKSVIEQGVLVESYRPGTWLDYANAQAMTRAAQLLAQVHAVVPAVDCTLERPQNPLQAQLEECSGYIAEYAAFDGCDARALQTIEALFDAAQAYIAGMPAPAAADCAHILNTELVASHFLLPDAAAMSNAPGGVDAESAPAGCICDWEKPIIGEVAQDIAYFLSPTTTIWDTPHVLDDAQRQTFIDEYWHAVGARFDRGQFDLRLRAYVMTNCLRGITWSARAISQYARQTAQITNQKTRNKLGIYISTDFLDMVRRRFFSGVR